MKIVVVTMIWILILLVISLLTVSAMADVQREAYRYQRFLTAEVQREWGDRDLVSVHAAQIHQESGWDRNARSRYARGMTQFTPSTEQDLKDRIGGAGAMDPYWSIRAMVRYDADLFDSIDAADFCDRWAMTLSSYNGGIGWLRRDKRLTEKMGDDASRWWDNTEKWSNRAQWAFRENREYVVKIIRQWQPMYLLDGWAGKRVCKESEAY